MWVVNLDTLFMGIVMGYSLHVLWEHRAEIVNWVKWMEEH